MLTFSRNARVKSTFKGRINLTEQASQKLSAMVDEIKQRNAHVDLNPSKLCSWIVERFVASHFSNDIKDIIKENFNRKRYVEDMLKRASSEEEIQNILQAALKPLWDGKRQYPAKQTKENQKSVDN